MKPLGLSIGLGERGITLGVRRPSAAEDAIWEAVRAAIDCGMTPRQFRIECAQAWEEELTEAGRDAAKELMKS